MHPIDISILCAYAVVQIADALAQLVEHSCRFQGGRETMLLFTIYLVLDEKTVYASKSLAARHFWGVLWRGVIQHAPELGRKTVAP